MAKSQDAKKTAKKEPLKRQKKRKKKNEIKRILPKEININPQLLKVVGDFLSLLKFQ